MLQTHGALLISLLHFSPHCPPDVSVPFFSRACDFSVDPCTFLFIYLFRYAVSTRHVSQTLLLCSRPRLQLAGKKSENASRWSKCRRAIRIILTQPGAKQGSARSSSRLEWNLFPGLLPGDSEHISRKMLRRQEDWRESKGEIYGCQSEVSRCERRRCRHFCFACAFNPIVTWN